MKRMKKLVALVLTLVMTMALGIAASAATITVNNAVEGQTYSEYKLFDVTKNADDTNYAYSTTNGTLVSAIENAQTQDGELNGVDLAFEETTVSGKYNVIVDDFDEDQAAILAAWISNNVDSLNLSVVQAVGTKQDDSSIEASFTDLDAGYYFVTSSVGSLCILNTTDSSQTIVEKNEEPTVEKKITNTDPDSAQVGDTVNFEITINAQPGAENYVLHDEMSAGLTLTQGSIEVKVGDTTLISSKDYHIDYPSGEDADGCDFEITFTKTYLDSITTATTITVTYSAVLNENAVESTDPETNEAILKYGQNNNISTTPAETETYTYDFVLTKTDEAEQPLTGAEFSLYSQEEDGEAISLVDLENGNYRIATADDQTTTTTIKVNSQGKATIEGLAGKDYWLEETKAPDGYNMLTERQKVEFNKNVDPSEADFDNITVENKAGSLLPSTGGMGTTVLYVAGIALVIGAGVVLVVRRRMNAQ